MALHVNTFKGGLDLDTNVNAYDNTHYPYALNLRILSDGENSSGTLTSMEESEIVFNIQSGWSVVGVSKMRDSLVMFTKNGTSGKIYYIPFSSLSSGINIEDYLKINKAFNFGDNVQIVARYETSTIQKIYWVDGVNGLRFANLFLDASDFSTMLLSAFDIVQEVTLSTPSLSSMTNGTLKVGVVQYAYCLYNLGGAETGYSPTTQPIPISSSSLDEATSLLFRGSNIGEISNKGVILLIPDIDTDFDRIRVVRLFYAEQNGTPEVDIIYEGVATSSLIITDTGGTSLGTISINDYRYIPNIFSAKTLETKNDYLFAGNISESSFTIDFDARAYRFNSSRNSLLYNADLSTLEYTIDGTNPDYDAIAINADCANKFNDVSTDETRSAADICKFKSNGTTLGGSGKYVEFSFTATERIIDSGELDSQFLRVYTNSNSSGYQDLSNPILVTESLGYQRDEIYRFAIVFFDKYGRQSFAKWIADIRFPSEVDGWWYTINGNNNIRDLGIVFTLNTDALDYLNTHPEIVSWQIVRAERTYDTATVKDCGYISSLYNDGSAMRWRDLPQISSSSNNTPLALEYMTPETNYNKNNYTPYNRLDIYEGNTLRGLTSKNTDQGATSIIFKLTGSTTQQSPVYKSLIKSLLFKHANSEEFTSMNSVDYSRQLSNRYGPMYSLDNPGADPRYYPRCTKGTTLILRISGTAPSNGVKYVRRRGYSYPYGGAGFNNRINTQYYPCDNMTDISTSAHNVYGGDCYIGWFEYLRGVWSTATSIIISNDDARQRNLSNQTAYLLVETKINLKYTTNPTWSYYDNGVIADYYSDGKSALARAGYEYNAMREVKGVYNLWKGDDNFFTQTFDLYTYNPVYSQINKSKVFVSEPLDFVNTNIIDTRIYRTSKKINGESSDTWTKFPINNLLDLDTKYGGLTKLLAFNDKLIFLQDSGVGVIAVAEREIVTTNTGSATTIGTGGVMERYDYISTLSGSSEINAIDTSAKTLYYIDNRNKKLCRLTEGVEYLSDLKGLKSFMDTATYTTTRVLFSPNFNEIWFKLTDDVVVFNEYLNAFTTFTDENFLNGIQYSNQLYTVSTSSTFKKLDIPDTYKDVSIHLLVSPTNQFSSRFDSITLSTTVDRNNTIQAKSFTNIGLSNRYQSKASTTFNARNRMRQWIYNDMRNDSDSTRFIDSYLLVDLDFNKTATNERIKVYDMITNYTPINAR